MKNRNLVNMFENNFKGKFNNNIYSNAKAELIEVADIDSLEMDNQHLQNFVVYFCSMEKKVERAIQYLEVITEKSITDIGFVKRLIYKNKLREIRKIYSNMGLFQNEFMQQKGVSLVRVEDNLFYYGNEEIALI